MPKGLDRGSRAKLFPFSDERNFAKLPDGLDRGSRAKLFPFSDDRNFAKLPNELDRGSRAKLFPFWDKRRALDSGPLSVRNTCRLAGGGDGEHSGLHSYMDLGLNDCLSEVCLREHLELTLDDREWERERAEWVVRLWSSVGSCLCAFW